MSRTYSISDQQEQQFIAWKEEHLKTCPIKPDFSGAWCKIVFVPSGLGNSVSVECFCGARVYLNLGGEL